MTRFALWCSVLLFALPQISSSAQLAAAPTPQTGTITGVVLDTDEAFIPGAKAVLTGEPSGTPETTTADSAGAFHFDNVPTGVALHVVVSAKDFVDWTSPDLTLQPNQTLELANLKLKPGAEVSVAAEAPEQLAIEQVEAEIHQRVLGIIPNFYVVYSHNPVPLSSKLKYELAIRSSFDVTNVFAAAFLGSINQAADTPDYREGAAGYGQRIGAVYTDGVTDIMFGGAVLPVLLHQDPRYYYKGEGTKKSRLLHAAASPFFCRGDNGKTEFNYSSIGGSIISGAISNTYYPNSDRGADLVFRLAAISTAGRIVNALAQEFVLKKLTSKPKVVQ